MEELPMGTTNQDQPAPQLQDTIPLTPPVTDQAGEEDQPMTGYWVIALCAAILWVSIMLALPGTFPDEEE